MPGGQGQDAELFAAAVEQGAPAGGDPELARDLQIVAMLRARGGALAPRPDERARAKQRLMALLAEQSAQPVDTGAAEPPPNLHVVRHGRRVARHSLPSGMTSRPVPRPAGPRRRTRALRGKALVGAAAILVLVATGGTGLFASLNALPGENLYALKRVAESTGVALAFDDTTKAFRNLNTANTRIDEVEQMVRRSPRERVDPDLVTSTLDEFAAATAEGSRMLLGSGELAGSPTLQELRSWAAAQSDRLTALLPALPGAAAPEARGALQLLQRLAERTRALERRAPCAETTAGRADDLGPLPATGPCEPVDRGPASPSGGAGDTDGTEDTGATPAATPDRDAPPPPTRAPRSSAPGGSTAERSTPGLLPEAGGPQDVDGPTGGRPRDGLGTTAAPSAGPAEPASLLAPAPELPVAPGAPGG